MADWELDAAVEAAVRLGAEQSTETEPSGYVHQFPDWLFDALDRALPEHLGYGRVEGVLIQRGPRATGGYRLVQKNECLSSAPAAVERRFKSSLHAIFPTVLRARVRRLLLEAQASGHGEEVTDSGGPAEATRGVAPGERVRGHTP